MSLGFSSLPSRASDDLKAAITNVRAPLLNELDADSIEAIKTRLIEIGTILGLSDGSTASSVAKALGAAFGAESGTRALMRDEGVNTHLRHEFGSVTAPTADDDSGDGFGRGSIWIDKANGLAWICTDASSGAAVWRTLPVLEALGLQTFQGEVSFDTNPVCSLTPGADEHLANKLYVDNAISAAIDYAEAGDIAPVGTAAAAGVSAELPRADHVHAHGAQTDGSLHAVATAAVAGFLSAEDYDWIHEGTRYSGDPAEDFLGNQGVTGTAWTSSLSGAGASVGSATSAAQHPGLIALNTGTTTTGKAAIYRGGSTTFKSGSDAIRFSCIFRVPTLSTVGEEFIAYVGWSDTLNAEPANGLYLLYDRLGQGTKLMACSANGGTRTRTDTGVTLNAGDWIRCYFVFNAAGTSCEFFIGVNGATPTSVATLTTNLPGTASMWTAQALILKSAGATNRALDVDRIRGWYWTLSAAR